MFLDRRTQNESEEVVRMVTPHGISYSKTIMYAFCHYHQMHRIGMIRFDVILLQ